jgi:hypothetical protein
LIQKLRGLEVQMEINFYFYVFTLYHTDVPLDEEEKFALFDLKILWEVFERVK